MESGFFFFKWCMSSHRYVCIPGDDLGKCCLFSLLLGVGKEDQVDRGFVDKYLSRASIARPLPTCQSILHTAPGDGSPNQISSCSTHLTVLLPEFKILQRPSCFCFFPPPISSVRTSEIEYSSVVSKLLNSLPPFPFSLPEILTPPHPSPFLFWVIWPIPT